jgi:hypothetical protein
MARGELLRKLFLSHKRGAEDDFRAAALEIVSEEQAKKNRQLARDLMNILDSSRPVTSLRDVNGLPRDREKQALLVEVEHPQATLDDIILRPQSRSVLDRIITEYRHYETLRTHGLAPKRRFYSLAPRDAEKPCVQRSSPMSYDYHYCIRVLMPLFRRI